ncbi:MAG: glutaredoxin family protein [Nitrosospira sp.]
MVATTNNPAASDTGRDPFALMVYSREHCHLCQDMIASLRELQMRLSFHFDVVDVDSDEKLQSRYGLKVPVLVAGEEEICHYHLDPIALDAYFAKIR